MSRSNCDADNSQLRWDRGRDDSALERVTRERDRWQEIAGVIAVQVVRMNRQNDFSERGEAEAFRQAWAGKLDEVK